MGTLDTVIYRLATFASWPKNAPQLEFPFCAQIGLFYTHRADDVQCFHCQIVLSNWDQGDKPLEKHLFKSSNCQYLRTYLKQQYGDFERRLATYRDVSWPRDSPVSPLELAKMGFYYTGVDDRVRSIQCWHALSKWNKGETAAEKHKKLYSDCPFVQNQAAARGHTVKLKFSLSLRSSKEKSATSSVDYEGASNRFHSLDGKSGSRGRNQHNLAVVNIAKNMGYGDKIIKHALRQLHSSGTPVTANSLLDTVFRLEESEGEYKNGAGSAQQQKDVTNTLQLPCVVAVKQLGYSEDLIRYALGIIQSLELTPTSDILVDVLWQLQKMDDEKGSRTDERTLCDRGELCAHIQCKICDSRSLNILFLPCHHLVCCEACSKSLTSKKCPLCRRAFESTIKVYIS